MPALAWHGLRARGLGCNHVYSQTLAHGSVFRLEWGQGLDEKKKQGVQDSRTGFKAGPCHTLAVSWGNGHLPGPRCPRL